jgi:hypothetical protein
MTETHRQALAALRAHRGQFVPPRLVATFALCAIATAISGCDTRSTYTQELEWAPGQTATAEITMALRENCAWGESCGDSSYYITRQTLRVTTPRTADLEWTGSGYAPVFLGPVRNDIYLVLFARSCHGAGGALLKPHPVFRWDGDQWQRVPRDSLGSGIRANLMYTTGTRTLQGRKFSLDQARQRLDDQQLNIYSKAAADLDFDKWYGLIFGRCAGAHDRN